MKRAFLALLFATPAGAQTPVYDADPYPLNATPVSAYSGNVANAAASATLAAVAGRTNYVNSIVMTGGGATAAAVVTCTVTGLTGGTMTFIFGAPLGAGVPAAPLVINFIRPLKASAANVAIAASCPALGTGNTRAAMSISGFHL